MKAVARVAISFVSFALAVIYALPNLALFFGIALAFYSKYVSLVFCMIFAWNIAKMVESMYGKSRDTNEDKKDNETDWVHGQGFSYTVKDDKVTFTFRDIPNQDGRQLSRLKFMREKFFKNED